MSSNKIAILLASLSFMVAFFVNELNLHHVKKEAPEMLRLGQTIETADDDGYIKTYDRLIEHGSFYDEDLEKYNSVIRTPGYGVSYFIFRLFLNKEKALVAQKIWQFLLFAISVYCLFFIAETLLKNRCWALITTSIYGLFPFSMGFLYYTLTESITPAILIVFIYFLIKASVEQSSKKINTYYIFASLSFAYLFIVRPFLGVFGVLIFVFLWHDYKRGKIVKLSKKIILYGALSISFMVFWQVRNYSTLGKITSLHPIYQNEMPGLFRSPHKALWNLFKGWEDNGANFHQTIVPFWERINNGDTTYSSIEQVINKMPEYVVEYFSKEHLNNVFKKYELAVLSQQHYYQNRLVMSSDITNEEKLVVSELNALEQEFKKEFWFIYHVKTPLKVFKNLALHSNLSLYIFQSTFRGNVFMEILRWLCLMIHLSTFTLCLIYPFINKDIKLITLGGIVLFYLFYLTYVQRGIEERYTLPLLAIALILSAYVLKNSFKQIISK